MFAHAVPAHAQRLPGPWHYGAALDYYTYHSTGWRPPLGELMNQYKYTAVDPAVPLTSLVHTVASFLTSRLPMTFNYVTYVPNASGRAYTRSTECLADTLGSLLRIPVAHTVLANNKKHSVKDVPRDKRPEFLKGLFSLNEDAPQLANRQVLLLDDVYETGATAKAVYALLQRTLRPKRTVFLAITRIWMTN